MGKRIKIALTDRRPVEVDVDQWPRVAEASNYDNGHACQANHEWYIRVRQHEDGRTIVYAAYEAGPGGVPPGFRARHAGELLGPDADVVAAIRRVGETAGVEDLIDECIADLPAEEL